MLKIATKFTLIISLFCSIAFAGEQGNGGLVEGEQGNGGKTCVENCLNDKKFDSDKSAGSNDSIIEFINKFFTKLIG